MNENEIKSFHSKKRLLPSQIKGLLKLERKGCKYRCYCYSATTSITTVVNTNVQLQLNDINGAGLFRKKYRKKNTCAVMISIIITFANEIFL